MPPRRGEGMTDTSAGQPEDFWRHATGQPPRSPESYQTSPSSFPPASLRRTASASRTYGRFAVGLRPILDPAAALGAAQKPAENAEKISPPPDRG